jgi:hypothetical protein
MKKQGGKIFCLISGIEGPSGLSMLNSQFFPLGKAVTGKIVTVIALGILCLAIAVRVGISP